MNYSEREWLIENKESWSIWNFDEEEDSSMSMREYDQRVRKIMNFEEDCSESFFLHECSGDCKNCDVQKEYLEFTYCDDEDECQELCMDIIDHVDYPCAVCKIGIRLGRK